MDQTSSNPPQGESIAVRPPALTPRGGSHPGVSVRAIFNPGRRVSLKAMASAISLSRFQGLRLVSANGIADLLRMVASPSGCLGQRSRSRRYEVRVGQVLRYPESRLAYVIVLFG